MSGRSKQVPKREWGDPMSYSDVWIASTELRAPNKAICIRCLSQGLTAGHIEHLEDCPELMSPCPNCGLSNRLTTEAFGAGQACCAGKSDPPPVTNLAAEIVSALDMFLPDADKHRSHAREVVARILADRGIR